jgi:hypothetical protein
MDILASFEGTQWVLQAEQILIRRRIPFETVPLSRYQRKHCGLGIIFAEAHLQAARLAFAEAQVKAVLKKLPEADPQAATIAKYSPSGEESA